MSNCKCKSSHDVFNGVCGRCLMPLYGTSHNENGMMIQGPRPKIETFNKKVVESLKLIKQAEKLFEDLDSILNFHSFDDIILYDEQGYKDSMIKRIVKELKKR